MKGNSKWVTEKKQTKRSERRGGWHSVSQIKGIIPQLVSGDAGKRNKRV